MFLMMVKLPSSSSSSDSNIPAAKLQTRSKRRLLPKNTGWFEPTTKTKTRNVWQLFSEISPKKRNRRQKKKIPATVTHPTEIMEEEMEDLIIEDDIEVMRDISATTFPSPKRSEKFSKFLQKFNKSSNIRKEFKSPRPVKRKRDHRHIPEHDDLEYDVFEDINSSERLKAAATGVCVQYETPPKYLQHSPSIPVGLSRKFLNSTAQDGHQHNFLEFTQDISDITSGNSKQTSEETTPSRFPALHTGNKRRKKSCKKEKKKPASSTRLFQSNYSDLGTPDLSPVIHLTGRQSIQTEDKHRSRNKRKSSTEDNSGDAEEDIENPPSPLSLIKMIVNKSLINKQSTFTQGDGIHAEAEFGISSIKDDDDDDDDFLQPKPDTRYIDSRDFYQTYDIEEIEIPDVICINDDEDKELVPVKTSKKHGEKSKNTSSDKQNEDQSIIEYNTNNNSISGEGSTIVEKLLNKKSSKLSKTAQTILEVASPGIRNKYSMSRHNSSDGSTLVEKPIRGNSSKVSKTAQTILKVASAGIRYPKNNDTVSSDNSETLLEKPLKRKSSKLSKTAETILKVASAGIRYPKNNDTVSSDNSATLEKPLKRTSKMSKTAQTILGVASLSVRNPYSIDKYSMHISCEESTLVEKPSKGILSKLSNTAETILEVASPGIEDFSKNKSMTVKSCASSLNSSKDHHKSFQTNKPGANMEHIEDSCTMKNTTLKSRRRSTSGAVEKEISICCLQTLNFPSPIKVLISQKTIPTGKRFTTEIQTASEDILGKAVPPPKGISKECRKKRSMYYFKDVKRYGRGK